MESKYKDLVKLAINAKELAYVPYSKFKVGSVLITKKGVYYGANIENSSYSMTMCAERNAIFKAVLDGNTIEDFLTIVVNGDTVDPIIPCGACLQVMNEFFNTDTEVVLSNKDGNFKTYKFSELMPLRFKELIWNAKI